MALSRDSVTPAWREDQELARRLDLGDEAAFETFVQDHVPRLYRYALSRLGGNTVVAQDAVQTAVCKALDKLEQYRGTAALFTWLCSICHNEIASHRRREGRAAEVPWSDDALLAMPATRPVSPASELASKDTTGLVHLALDRLPANQARALEWKYIDGLSVHEIGARLGVTAKAAESILSRARAGFRDAHAGVAKGLDGRGFRGLRGTGS